MNVQTMEYYKYKTKTHMLLVIMHTHGHVTLIDKL